MADTSTSTSMGGIKTDLPLALLPVRLETRFVSGGSTGTQLLVRVYPDDIHVDSHELGLTETEITWGQHFWVQTFTASDPAHQRAAWSQLVERFGAPRAAYVAETLTPTNDPDPSATPRFPSVPQRAADWTRTSHTRVLPDRWVARGWAGGRVVFTQWGNTIPDPLAVGPSPERGFAADSLASDPDAGWLVSFDAAERVGMGLRIPYPLPPGTKLDRLVVLGVKASHNGASSAGRLTELLQAHRYTSGLAFVPQGTPTNNTPEAPAGYHSLEPNYLAGPLASRAAPAVRPGDGSNRDVASRALGMSDTTFDRLTHSGLAEQRDAAQMNAALWQTTWGYFLEQLLAGDGAVPLDAISQAREHFIAHVRARGPLPALRVGQQPYGVLPVVSLTRWQPREGSSLDEPLVHILRTLRPKWEQSLSAVPRLAGSRDPAGDLLRVLAMAPGAVQHVVRRAQAITLVTSPPSAEAIRSGDRSILPLAQSLGITWTPRLIRSVFAPYPLAFVLGAPRAQTGVPSETEPPEPNYLWTLGTTAYADIRREAVTGRQDTLLYLLLRQATLLEYVAAASRLRRALIQPTPPEWRERDWVQSAAETPWALLDQTVSGLSPSAAGAYLDSVRAQFWARLTDLQDRGEHDAYWTAQISSAPAAAAAVLGHYASFVRALHYLAGQPAAELDRHVAETLDLCSHRLDAWITSVASKRLEWLRRSAPRGIYLGGYGWVEDLAPAPLRQEIAPPAPNPDEPAPPELARPLYDAPGNQGFVHAPSLAHATTAAILRSAYVSRRATGDGNALAVNLSSERVRTALWLLEGVRQGQSLGALLGYRFERGLHENYPATLLLDRYIATFRRIAPLEVRLPAASDTAGWQALESVPATNVIDGLALLRRWRAPGGDPLAIPWGAANRLPSQGTPEFNACQRELARLEDAVDAIGDLTLAEAVHQVGQGNPVRAGAALDAITRGEAPPPDLEVIRTPRSGVGLTHRIAVLFAGSPAAPGWGTMGTQTLRALAEPFLNGWAARLLGPGAPSARCRVAYYDLTTGAVLTDAQGAPQRRELTLADLSLAPLDVVYLPEGSGEAQRSELEQRVFYYALRTRPSTLPANVGVRITFGRDPRWPASVLSFTEVLEVARTVRRLIASARALTPQDLALPDATIPPAAEADAPPPDEPPGSPERRLRLGYRADASVSQLRGGYNDLQATVPHDPTQPMQTEAVRNLLLALTGFGIPGAVPLVAVGDDPETRATLRVQAESIAQEIRARLERIDVLDSEYRAVSNPTPVTTRDYHVARLREVFGPDFRVLPRFTAPNAADLGRSFAASSTLQGGNPREAVTWFQRVARVRDGAARLNAALLYAETLGGPALDFTVGQLPFETGERWVALPHTGPQPAGGRVSFAVQAPAGLNLASPLAGLLVDEWIEVIPSAQETTGLTFHYDQPGTRAPQAILLAVTPDTRTAWDLETLEATVLETLDLAKLRAVDLTALGEVGHYLPAVYVGHNPSGDTVATDFSRVAAPVEEGR